MLMRALAGLLVAACALTSAARAEFPQRTITLLVSFPPGGLTDIPARIIAPEMQQRLGAVCGIVFPIATFLAAGNGNHFVPWRAVIATWALVLALPFFAYLYSVLHRAEGEGGWLATAALVGGARAQQQHVARRAQVPHQRPHAPDRVGGHLPALREHVLPRWLGVFAALTAVALAANAAFLFAGFVPALLLFLLWTLVTSVVLLRRSWSPQPAVAYST